MLFDLESNESFWLINAHVPRCLTDLAEPMPTNSEGLCSVNIKIVNSKVERVVRGDTIIDERPCLDLQQQIVLPCFIDLHAHLDKGHIWQRSPNEKGTFDLALSRANGDAEYWQPEDIYRRFEFGLRCSYAHGTQAIRTHIDAKGEQLDLSLEVFQSLQSAWQDKMTLQVVGLVGLDYYQTTEGEVLADKIADVNGVLGGVAWQDPDLELQLDRLFTLAKARNLALDLHVDENGDPNSNCLQQVAEAAIRHDFTDRVTCGHCCSLAVQSAEVAEKTIALVEQAQISVVSLPMCNLYLQDRQEHTTPYWRGVTRVHELRNSGVPVAFASDNCRDPFFGFGDHDMLEVFEQSVRIAHLDSPYGNWIESVTSTPARIMGLNLGTISPGSSADLIIFPGRYYSELLSRSQHNRIVIRHGKKIDAKLPDYRELDDLIDKKAKVI